MLAKKLQVRPGSRVAVLGAPPDIDLVLPPGVIPSNSGPADIVLVYVPNRASLTASLAASQKRLVSDGLLWIAYPKGGQLGTDLNRDILALTLHSKGLEPVSQIAVDDVWSALRVKRDAKLSAERTARGAFGAKAPKKSAAKKPASKRTAAPSKKSAAPSRKKSATKKKGSSAAKAARGRR
jgi:hypothetical protein